jgi:hypothetical protein
VGIFADGCFWLVVADLERYGVRFEAAWSANNLTTRFTTYELTAAFDNDLHGVHFIVTR